MRLSVVLPALFVSLSAVQAGNLILNPGFETGDFSSWTVTLASSGSHLLLNTSAGFVHSGNDSADFGGTSPGFYDTISQTFATVNGQSYTFSFFLAGDFSSLGVPSILSGNQSVIGNLKAVDPNGDFQAFWDGNLVFDSTAGVDPTSFGFSQHSFAETGTGSDTIMFQGYNVPNAYYLDDASVDAASVGTPEPATWFLIVTGLAGLVAFRRIRRPAIQ